MGVWNFSAKAEDDGSVIMSISLNEIDANGALSGSVKFKNRTYNVTGQWAAKGSVAGRNASVFWFGGATSDDAPVFLVAAGDVSLTAQPNNMQIAVTTANSGDGGDYGYNGELYRTDQPQPDPGPDE